MSRTFVYEIRDRDTGYFKIGWTTDPKRRLRKLMRQDTLMPRPNDFELVGAWEGDQSDEGFLHNLLKPFRVRGEWFCLKTDKTIVEYFLDRMPYDRDYTERQLRQWFIDDTPNATNIRETGYLDWSIHEEV